MRGGPGPAPPDPRRADKPKGARRRPQLPITRGLRESNGVACVASEWAGNADGQAISGSGWRHVATSERGREGQRECEAIEEALIYGTYDLAPVTHSARRSRLGSCMDLDPPPLPQQRLAIEAPLGPVLVVAGPGAGKTFCLIARINHLINNLGMAPERICAVTFTNRAAEEVAVRLKHTLGDRADGVTRGTIHALCLALLREHAEAAGLRKGFGVADEQYQKVILGRLHVPLEQRGSLLNRFSRHRVQKLDYELTADDARLYREYAVWLAHRNMLDFDDLVTKAEELLRTRGDIADAIAARWDYLLVDEFQDVNAVQYDLLKRLAVPHGNFFAVGDDEQSIFTWTGADPYVLVRFGRDYEIDRPIVLDKNCRCSRQIFETARRVLAQNPQLFEKQLSAEQESPYEVGAFEQLGI